MLSPNLTYIWIAIAVLLAVLIIAATAEIVDGYLKGWRWRRYRKSMQAYHEGVDILAQRLSQQNRKQLDLISSRDADDEKLFNMVEEYRNDFGGPGEAS